MLNTQEKIVHDELVLELFESMKPERLERIGESVHIGSTFEASNQLNWLISTFAYFGLTDWIQEISLAFDPRIADFDEITAEDYCSRVSVIFRIYAEKIRKGVALASKTPQ